MFNGQLAIVTGSTSGIGLAIASALARAGANTMLNGFGDVTEIERLRAGLASEAGVQVLYSSADMSKPEAIASMVADAEAQFGAVDIIVNNTGIQFVAPVEEFPIEKWSQILPINLTSNFCTIRAALQLLADQHAFEEVGKAGLVACSLLRQCRPLGSQTIELESIEIEKAIRIIK